ncbi:MAG: flagellar basal body P-ring formation protein FlgA [Proteobacteria bacterium]|jgi:flagella basal body P-ring formation protein FlgA|nr:flagellar basal body P-ring formation chaperone FlgA [Alphaproteobacteria bacterium]NCC03564.1 flagellar basal body P-ring formation protein FlgA [Pseudomonadota bacterium]
MKKVIALLLLSMLWTTSAQAGALVVLKPVTEVKGTAIRLSDVFDGVPANIDRDIALAPDPGKSVTYDVRILTRLAQQYRLDWQAQSAMDRSEISRAANYVTLDMARDAIKDKLVAAGMDASAQNEILLDNRSLSIALPVDQAPTFDLTNFSYDQQSKRFRTDLVVAKSPMPVKQSLTGRVVVKRQVPVLSKRLSSGTIVSSNDLEWITVNEDQLGSDVLLQAENIIGQELRRDQGSGLLLRARDLAQPRLVLRGSIVTMKVHTPLMQITVQGRALQDGVKGETVRVKNLQSNRIIEGQVESNGTVAVRVDTLGNLASAE